MKTVSVRKTAVPLLALAGAAAAWAQTPKIAILDSEQNTRSFFFKHYPACDPAAGSFYLGADEYQRYFQGWVYMVQHELGLAPDIIHDSDVADASLNRYRLVILSNTASLSDEQSRAISQWVIRGGRLIATFGAGYKDIVSDPRQADGLKLQKGGTFALHQLWHDPVTKLFSSMWLTPGVDVRITQYEGPTACLEGQLPGDLLPYGADANMLVQRPPQYHDALGFLTINNPVWTRPAPAILSSRIGHGLLVYLAFAPEYLVSKEFGLPAPETCPDGQNWAGRSEKARLLMRCMVTYLLAN